MSALCVSSAGKEDKEMNEFYEVMLMNGSHFFKSKDKAFSFLWQEFLNVCGDLPDEALDDASLSFLTGILLKALEKLLCAASRTKICTKMT